MKIKIDRIKPPKYKVGRYSLNEYELRKLMLQVCKGAKPAGIIVKDEKGTIATIQPDGSLDRNIAGLELNSRYTLDMIAHRRDKAGFRGVPAKEITNNK